MAHDGSDSAEAARRARATQRRHMTATVLSLGQTSSEGAPLPSVERLELVATLTAAAWAMAGLPWPTLPRAQWPIRVRALGEPA